MPTILPVVPFNMMRSVQRPLRVCRSGAIDVPDNMGRLCAYPSARNTHLITTLHGVATIIKGIMSNITRIWSLHVTHGLPQKNTVSKFSLSLASLGRRRDAESTKVGVAPYCEKNLYPALPKNGAITRWPKKNYLLQQQ